MEPIFPQTPSQPSWLTRSLPSWPLGLTGSRQQDRALALLRGGPLSATARRESRKRQVKIMRKPWWAARGTLTWATVFTRRERTAEGEAVTRDHTLLLQARWVKTPDQLTQVNRYLYILLLSFLEIVTEGTSQTRQKPNQNRPRQGAPYITGFIIPKEDFYCIPRHCNSPERGVHRLLTVLLVPVGKGQGGSRGSGVKTCPLTPRSGNIQKWILDSKWPKKRWGMMKPLWSTM